MGLGKILVVDDSQPMREYLSELLQLLGFCANQVRRKTDFLAELSQHAVRQAPPTSQRRLQWRES